MANGGHNWTNENMTLSQSYSQGVERIRKQMNETGPLELPREILIEREHAWDRLFDKYSENVSNDIEINIRDSNSESKENEFEDDNNDDDNEKDDNEYFPKCRTPMRKHPALVQYWVDTGNPPYPLLDDNSSVTGSSLSEAENSKSTLQIVNERSNVENKRSNSTSLCSSVDTKAYILSNTNVTKKSVATAIMEGVKNTNTSPRHYVNTTKGNILSKNSSTDGVTKNKTVDVCDTSDKLKNALHTREGVQLTTNTLMKNANTNKKTDKNLDHLKLDPIMHNSMKITDILPTLAQFDELLMPKNIQENQQDKIPSDDTSLFGGTPKTFKQPRSFNRKKLYTERNSPIDVIVSVLGNNRRLSRSNFHPALCTPSIKRNTLFSRRRTSLFQKHRKKRFSQLADALKNSGKTMNDKKGHETNQHDSDKTPSKSLELTQSDSKMCCRTRTTPAIDEISLTMDVNKECTLGDIDILKTTTRSCANDNRKPQIAQKLKNLVALCSRKYLEIRLERYEEKNSSPKDISQKYMTNRQLSKSPYKNKLSDKVHEAELESQASDQSTILIYKCANDQGNNIMSTIKSHNESNRENNDETKKIHWTKRRKRNKPHRRRTSKNIQVTTENKRGIHKINDSSVILHSKLVFTSDEDSPTKMSSKFLCGSPTHFQNSVIKFSSDEEDDFLCMIRKNSNKHTGNCNIVIPTSDQSRTNIRNNCKNLIENLACQSTEDREIPTASATAMNLAIINSDDEEMINAQIFGTNTKKTTNLVESSVRTRSRSDSCGDMDTNGKSVGDTVVKVLRHDSALHETDVDARIGLPTKKLKLTRNRAVKRTKNTAIKVSRKTSEEFVDNNSNRCGPVLQVDTNVPRCNGRQMETEVPFTNETNGIVLNNIPPRLSEISSSFAQESGTICKGTIVSLDKLQSFSECPPSQRSHIRRDGSNAEINSSCCIEKIDSNGNMKLRIKNPSKLKRNTVENENVSGTSDSTRSAEFNYSKLNGASAGENKCTHGSGNTIKSSSTENTDEDNIHKSRHREKFPSLFDDSSSDGSLEYYSHGRSYCVKMKRVLKNKTVTFRTKSDDSESDESIDLQKQNSAINHNNS